jgi:hypothetical protein
MTAEAFAQVCLGIMFLSIAALFGVLVVSQVRDLFGEGKR